MYVPSPFSAMQFTSLAAQHLPLQQALGPLQAAQQGPGASVQQMPFVPFTPPPAPSFAQPFQWMSPGLPNYSTMSFGGVLAHVSPPAPMVPFMRPVSAVPATSPLASVELSRRMAAAPLAGMTTAASLAATTLAFKSFLPVGFNLLSAAPEALGALGGGFANAILSGNIFSGAARLAGGVLSAGGILGRGLLAAGPQALLALGGYAALRSTLGMAYRGFARFGAVGRTAEAYFGGFRGLEDSVLFGAGIGPRRTQAIFGTIQEAAGQAFVRTDEVVGMYRELLRTGQLLGGVQNIKEMRRKLKQSFETATEIMNLLNTTFKNAAEMLDTLKQTGVFGQTQLINTALRARVNAGLAGISTEQMLQVRVQGAQMARSMGMYGGAGAAVLESLTTGIGTALRMGSLPEAIVRELAGGRVDVGAAAQGMAGGILNYLQTRGQYLMAALMTPEGNINRELVGQLAAGRISINQLLRRGVSNVSTLRGAVAFGANRQRLTAQFAETAGPELFSVIYEELVRAAEASGYDPSDPNALIMIAMSLFGMTEAQARAVVRAGSPEARVGRRILRRRVAAQMAREAYHERYGSLTAAIERSIITPVRRLGLGVEELFGTVRGAVERYTARVSRAMYGETVGPLYTAEDYNQTLWALANQQNRGALRRLRTRPTMSFEEAYARQYGQLGVLGSILVAGRDWLSGGQLGFDYLFRRHMEAGTARMSPLSAFGAALSNLTEELFFKIPGMETLFKASMIGERYGFGNEIGRIFRHARLLRGALPERLASSLGAIASVSGGETDIGRLALTMERLNRMYGSPTRAFAALTKPLGKDVVEKLLEEIAKELKKNNQILKNMDTRDLVKMAMDLTNQTPIAKEMRARATEAIVAAGLTAEGIIRPSAFITKVLAAAESMREGEGEAFEQALGRIRKSIYVGGNLEAFPTSKIVKFFSPKSAFEDWSREVTKALFAIEPGEVLGGRLKGARTFESVQKVFRDALKRGQLERGLRPEAEAFLRKLSDESGFSYEELQDALLAESPELLDERRRAAYRYLRAALPEYTRMLRQGDLKIDIGRLRKFITAARPQTQMAIDILMKNMRVGNVAELYKRLGFSEPVREALGVAARGDVGELEAAEVVDVANANLQIQRKAVESMLADRRITREEWRYLAEFGVTRKAIESVAADIRKRAELIYAGPEEGRKERIFQLAMEFTGNDEAKARRLAEQIEKGYASYTEFIPTVLEKIRTSGGPGAAGEGLIDINRLSTTLTTFVDSMDKIVDKLAKTGVVGGKD